MRVWLPNTKTLFVCGLVLLSGPFIGSCELTENHLKHDRENNFEPQDYRDALAPREVEVDADRAGRLKSGIPPLQQYVAQPDSNYKPFPLVSISVNQTVPLRDVIYEIAEQAQYDVELDPRIRGSIIFSARNRPLDVVINRLAEIAGLRYTFEDDILRVELDTPYHEIYKINYLALTRTNASSISNDISVVSGEGTDTGSNFSATNASTIDFWAELETNLTQIVESNRNANRLTTDVDPTVTVAETNPDNIQPLTLDDAGELIVQAPDATLNINQIPVDNTEPDDGEDPFAARFSLNQQAGLVSVFAPERLHKKIAVYMDELKKSVSSQVLIEAKVLEVTLSDEFSAGIDWNILDLGEGAFGFNSQSLDPTGAPLGFVRAVLNPATSNPQSNFNAAFNGNDFTAAIDAISRFGTVQALASPRLTVLNNQSAALNVVENVVYFEVDSQVTPGVVGAAPLQTFNTEARTVPEGVIINVQPSIDNDLQRVAMAIRPTITTITDFVADPNPDLGAVQNLVPQVNVQEFDSIIQMNNGQAVVMGGLIQDRVESVRNGTPVLSEVPVLGGLFRNQRDEIQKTELVVFLKATIVDGGNTIHNTDKDLYRTFSSDRRPLKF